MDLKGLLFSLSDTQGVSGGESSVSKLIKELIEPYCDSVSIDKLGNVIAVKKSINDVPMTLMLDAHMDQIGLMVTGITDEGFIRFTDITGVDKRTLLTGEVIIHGKCDVFGVVCCKPPHLTNKEEADEFPPVHKLVIDVGLSKEKAEEIISVGDFISLRSKNCELMNGQVCGKSYDNRASVAVIIKTFEELKNTKLPFNLVMLASVQEEAGCRGAKTGAYLVNPNEAIILDVTFAHTPDASKDETGQIGKGPMIGYASTINRNIYNKLVKLARTKKIPYQLEIMAGSTGTNTDRIQITRDGIPAGLISIPLKYMHTGIETISLTDLENTVKLLSAYILQKREEWAND